MDINLFLSQCFSRVHLFSLFLYIYIYIYIYGLKYSENRLMEIGAGSTRQCREIVCRVTGVLESRVKRIRTRRHKMRSERCV